MSVQDIVEIVTKDGFECFSNNEAALKRIQELVNAFKSICVKRLIFSDYHGVLDVAIQHREDGKIDFSTFKSLLKDITIPISFTGRYSETRIQTRVALQKEMKRFAEIPFGFIVFYNKKKVEDNVPIGSKAWIVQSLVNRICADRYLFLDDSENHIKQVERCLIDVECNVITSFKQYQIVLTNKEIEMEKDDDIEFSFE